MPPAARITDFHMCPMVTPGIPPIPHVGGPVIMGSPNVITGKMPQARMGDMAVCVGPPDSIIKGSAGVFVNKMPAARMGDNTAHGGAIMVGCPTVMIGEVGGAGGGGGGGGAGGKGQGGSGSSQELTHIDYPPPIAYAEIKAMIAALTNAAKHGTPFNEICFKDAPSQAPKP